MLDFLSLAAIGAVGPVGWKLYKAACFGIKRYLEPYFIAHEAKVKAKAELTIFRNDPLKQLEFAKEFLNNKDRRFPEEAVGDLKNICNVIKTAVRCLEGAQVDESPYTEAEEKEWYSRFFDEARYISDEDLQEVWGHLMAEKIIRPKGVNNRVLYFIRDLDKREIESIRRAMRVFLDNDFIPDQIVNKIDGLSRDFVTLLSLKIAYRSGDILHPLVICFDLNKDEVIRGKGYNFHLTSLDSKKKVELQCYALTPEGQVLSRMCGTELMQEEARIICNHLNECWKDTVRVDVVKS